jgi:hypothetical protein
MIEGAGAGTRVLAAAGVVLGRVHESDRRQEEMISACSMLGLDRRRALIKSGPTPGQGKAAMDLQVANGRMARRRREAWGWSGLAWVVDTSTDHPQEIEEKAPGARSCFLDPAILSNGRRRMAPVEPLAV